ncbi:MAG: hypothetical protein ACLR23_09335 [Clostridia bacterium]
MPKLIEFYKTGTPNDDDKIIAFMKQSDVPSILSNTTLWGSDLRYLTEAVERAL